MTALRHTALGCCILTAFAGMIRVFWPDNGMKPVINAVLVLYIVASVLRAGTEIDWQGLTGELRNWTQQESTSADYSEYLRQAAERASGQALQTILEEAGIRASVHISGTVCIVHLEDAEDEVDAKNCWSRTVGHWSFKSSQEVCHEVEGTVGILV